MSPNTVPGAVQVGEDAPIFHVMQTMRAMRRLKPDPVSDDLLTRVVEAATWAPSGSNAQGYEFVVVTDRERIAKVAELWHVVSDYYLAGTARAVPPGSTAPAQNKLRAAIQYQRDHFHDTPALIIACYDMGPYWKRLRTQVGHIVIATARLGPRRAAAILRHLPHFTSMGEAASIYPGVQNILLAARALGLGATITTWHQLLESEFKAALDIPASVHTYAIIPIGWPAGRLGSVTRRSPGEVIHHNQW